MGLKKQKKNELFKSTFPVYSQFNNFLHKFKHKKESRRYLHCAALNGWFSTGTTELLVEVAKSTSQWLASGWFEINLLAAGWKSTGESNGMLVDQAGGGAKWSGSALVPLGVLKLIKTCCWAPWTSLKGTMPFLVLLEAPNPIHLAQVHKDVDAHCAHMYKHAHTRNIHIHIYKNMYPYNRDKYVHALHTAHAALARAKLWSIIAQEPPCTFFTLPTRK